MIFLQVVEMPFVVIKEKSHRGKLLCAIVLYGAVKAYLPFL
jgi:hypothetical protein